MPEHVMCPAYFTWLNYFYFNSIHIISYHCVLCLMQIAFSAIFLLVMVG